MADLNDLFDSCEGLDEELRLEEQIAGYSEWSLSPEIHPSTGNTSRREEDLLTFEPQFGYSEWDYLQDTTNESSVVPPGGKEFLGVRVVPKLTLRAVRKLLGEDAWEKNRMAVLALWLLGLVAGHLLDTHVLPNCPSCRVALKAVNTVL
jgi:hypothetical protein